MTQRDCLQQLLDCGGTTTALTLVHGRQEVLRWSFSDLQQQSGYAEGVLQQHGAGAGDKLLLVAANSPQFFAVLLAALRLGLCVLPLPHDFSRTQLALVLQTHMPVLAIVDDAAMLASVAVATVLGLHERNQAWLLPLTTVQTRAPAATPGLLSAPDSPVLLFHSSGSTGTPKGMCYTRQMLNTFLDHLQLLYGAFPDHDPALPASDRVNVLPVTHFGGLSFCLQALLEKRALHLLRSRLPHDHLALLRLCRCQLILLVPALLHELLREGATPALPEMRHCLAMGEAVTPAQLQLLANRLNLPVHNAYGMSECLTGIFNSAADRHTPLGSCGRLRFGEARLLAADGSEHASEGELCVRNATTVPCYTDAALNRHKYRDGWFHTGDCLRRDAQGYYFYAGRLDQMCVINGRNVYPQEVEQVLLQHPAVQACVAAPITVGEGRQRLAVAVELQRDHHLTASELLDFYVERGAVFATPAWVQFCQPLPRLTGDKPDRVRCSRDLQQGFALASAGGDRPWPGAA